jgi:hypothetical protein
MSFDRGGSPKGRRNPSELHPLLRDRILALDEPVSWEDWDNVVARVAGRSPISGLRVGAVAVLAAASLAGMVAVLMFSLGRSSLIPFGSARRALPPVRRDFADFKLGAPPIASDAVASQTRIITSVRLRDGRHTLYVSPAKSGGFCYKWTGVSGGGCEQLAPASLSMTWDKRRALGVISSSGISAVRIEFTDGTVAEPRVFWISGPINAGFFLYSVPAGKAVAGIKGYSSGSVPGRSTWFSV